eukprot:CCRYP_012901-RA/>CCRYP_012901-RA protein AED:0.36 eAED:0.77 QI:0/0/0/1/0/0/2/0/103
MESSTHGTYQGNEGVQICILNKQPKLYCKVVRTMPAYWNMPDFHNSVHVLSTSMCAIITFEFESMKSLIKIFSVDTKVQLADTFTKALAQNDFVHHHKFMCVQ